MNWKRTATLAVVGGTLVTLLARASTSVVAPPSSSPPASSTHPPSAALTPDLDRLRERLSAPITPATPARNLFEFHSAAPPSSSRPPAMRDLPPATMPLPAAPAPPLTLLGLAEEATADGKLRTAIVSGASGLHFVHVGDTIVAGYRVTAISDDSVVVSAPDGATPLVLRLK